MSYCRWSSMNYKCDLYVFADVGGGVTVHVAGQRRIGETPDFDGWMQRYYSMDQEQVDEVDWDAASTEYRAMLEALTTIPLEPVGLSRDGESFRCIDPAEAAALITSLRDEGYLVPEGIEQEILEDFKDE